MNPIFGSLTVTSNFHLLTRRPAEWDRRLAPIATSLPAGTSAGVRAVTRQIEKIAQSDAPVLIEGETGSGKELAARAIWARGARRAGPFIPVNCGAIPDGLIETELFGHGAGAFTDAKHAREGVVAEAQHGILFLDEVNTLSPRGQVTLLRFLQDLRYRPVGTSTERPANVRIIAASNQPLHELVDAGRFRQDLFYRLNILELTIPPLRQRQDEILLLVEQFLQLFCGKYDLPQKRLHPTTAAWLRQHNWPGNVRELENWIHREVLLAEGDEIRTSGHPTSSCTIGWDALPGVATDYRAAKARALAEFDSAYLSHVLTAARGNVTVAARMAGKERRSFGRLLKKHGIDRYRFRN
ncbi:MAG TPA: sigma-54 dependent transcriptional regulator [Vicinamibacterales bacterium]|jgi:DNA-binding NtrC family response regulator|nr:sigma-54 dependent transcriptional regulator [Vicinamibacterales bacterium]